MPYSNFLSIEQALYFDLFDDIKYEWLKEVLDPKREDENDFEVEIKDIPNDENTEVYKTTQFTFELRKIDYVRFGETYYKTKTFVVKKTYLYSSPYGISLANNYEDTDDEEEEARPICEDCDEPKECSPDKCFCDPSDVVL